MILEADEENRDFISVQKKDFYKKRSRRPPPHVQMSEYLFPLNPLNGPYKEHLYSLRKNARLKSSERSEDLKANFDRVRSMHPNLMKILPDHTPDEDVVEIRDKKSFGTVYRVDYSADFDNYLSLTARRTGSDRPRVALPENWAIPETTQRISYRNFHQLVPELVSVFGKTEKPKDNLVPKEEERRILGVVTGESVYSATIGETGGNIVEKHLHGIPLPLEPPVIHDKGPDSVRSLCSITLMNPNYPHLSNVF